MDPLPLPPPPVAPGGPPMHVPRPHRAGDLTPAWRTVFVIGWAGVVMGLGAVLKTSRTMGMSTWWLGPEADPRSVVLQVLPFVAPVLLIIAGFRGIRLLPWYGLLGGVVMGAIAAGDLGRFDRLAIIELAVAGVGLAVSAASFAGVYRRGPVDAASTAALLDPTGLTDPVALADPTALADPVALADPTLLADPTGLADPVD